MLENTWREIEYRLDILRAMIGANVEVVWHSLKLLSYIFIFHKQFYFVISGLKIIGHENPDNNLESPCISVYKTNLAVLWLGISASNSGCFELRQESRHFG
jgi:hypothetical protein